MSKRRTSAWLAVRRGRENLSRTSGGCLAWMGRVRRRKSGKARDPCHGPWALVEPRDHAVDIDGGSDRDVLQVGLRHAPIPGPAQAKGAHPLRECPFDAGPPLIELLTLLAGIPGLRRCECLVLVLGRQAQPSACLFGTGTGRAHGTRPTRVLIKFYRAGCKFSVAPTLLVWAKGHGPNVMRRQYGQKKARDFVAPCRPTMPQIARVLSPEAPAP